MEPSFLLRPVKKSTWSGLRLSALDAGMEGPIDSAWGAARSTELQATAKCTGVLRTRYNIEVPIVSQYYSTTCRYPEALQTPGFPQQCCALRRGFHWAMGHAAHAYLCHSGHARRCRRTPDRVGTWKAANRQANRTQQLLVASSMTQRSSHKTELFKNQHRSIASSQN